MDRLLSLAGGQPLRSNDWDLIQDTSQEMLRSIIEGLKGDSSAVIVSGLVITMGDPNIDVTEGFLYVGGEIYYVPSASFVSQGETHFLYLIPNTTTGESRVFKDTSTKSVYQYRRYAIGYGTSVPSGGMLFPGANLLGYITNHVVAQVPVPEQLVKMATITISSSLLNQPQVIVPAQGASKAVKVIGLAAWISPATRLEVGAQDLKILYIEDETTESIGFFPNSFLESTAAVMQDMSSQTDGILINSAVKAQFSAGLAPSSGSANIKFFCYYTVITL